MGRDTGIAQKRRINKIPALWMNEHKGEYWKLENSRGIRERKEVGKISPESYLLTFRLTHSYVCLDFVTNSVTKTLRTALTDTLPAGSQPDQEMMGIQEKSE